MGNEYIERAVSRHILELQKYYRVSIITGPRQSGKTTLCHHLFPDYAYVSMDDMGTRARALSDMDYFMDTLGRTAIVDEVQNCPEILSAIKIRVDRDSESRYILTDSSNFSLLNSISESLAGRASLFELLPFSFIELKSSVKDSSTDSLMFRGLYPGTIADHIPPTVFYRNYYNTYVERDIRNVLKVRNLDKFDTFIRLLAGRAGSEANASSLAIETGVSSTTISDWISLLETAYLIFKVRPYHANLAKRLTKSPKIYFTDTGLQCYLLGINDESQLATHPLRGAIFENMAMVELMKSLVNANKDPDVSFYREQSGREVDALIANGTQFDAYEIKAGKTFRENFLDNLRYLDKILPSQIRTQTLIYDGPTVGHRMVNVRDV
jgi:predicted AAA+ superfamily ATPase